MTAPDIDPNPLDDPTVIAVLRLPVSISALDALTAGLEAAYGPGLVIRTHPHPLMVVALPEGRTDW